MPTTKRDYAMTYTRNNLLIIPPSKELYNAVINNAKNGTTLTQTSKCSKLRSVSVYELTVNMINTPSVPRYSKTKCDGLRDTSHSPTRSTKITSVDVKASMLQFPLQTNHVTEKGNQNKKL